MASRNSYDSENEDFGESLASETFPSKASALRKGGYILIRNHPCKIVEMSTSKPGKHGHAKVKINCYYYVDIFKNNTKIFM